MDQRSDGTGPTADQALLTFRIIGASLGLGVTLFAFVSWFLHSQGSSGAAPGDPALMFNMMIGLAALALAVAIVFWRARVAPLIETSVSDDERLARASELQSNVIIVWALAEAPALFAVVVYYLYGHVVSGILGVALIWIAIGLTWPQREWIAAGRRHGT